MFVYIAVASHVNSLACSGRCPMFFRKKISASESLRQPGVRWSIFWSQTSSQVDRDASRDPQQLTTGLVAQGCLWILKRIQNTGRLNLFLLKRWVKNVLSEKEMISKGSVLKNSFPMVRLIFERFSLNSLILICVYVSLFERWC